MIKLLLYTKDHVLDFVLDRSGRWSHVFCIFVIRHPRERTNANPSTFPHARGPPIPAIVPNWWCYTIFNRISLKSSTYAFVHQQRVVARPGSRANFRRRLSQLKENLSIENISIFLRINNISFCTDFHSTQ